MDEEKDRTMVQELLEFKDHMDNIMTQCFQNNDKFMQLLRDAFENFINQRQNKPAEMIGQGRSWSLPLIHWTAGLVTALILLLPCHLIAYTMT